MDKRFSVGRLQLEQIVDNVPERDALDKGRVEVILVCLCRVYAEKIIGTDMVEAGKPGYVRGRDFTYIPLIIGVGLLGDP